MASSGTVTINAWSVDNGHGNSSYWYCGSLPSGTCYSAGNASAFNRGSVQANITLNWSVNNSGLLSVSYNSTSYVGGTWYVCSVNGYHIDVDFSTDQVNWSTIMSSFQNNWPTCVADNSHKVESIASSLCSGLTPVTLTQSGYIRVRMWTLNACPTCNGVPTSEVWPNAFPNDAASIATAVPVHIDVSWTARIKYNANGGTGAPGDTTATNTGNTQTLTVSNTVPTRKNYRFDGWSYNGNLYHGGDTIVIQKSTPTITLMAAWTKFYHPGAILNGDSQWMSHDREGGACQMLTDVADDTWTDMRTIDAPTGLGDPPAVYHDSKYFNQRKVGKE